MKVEQSIEEKVKRTIALHKLIKPSDYVIIGVSGGADSMCLLHLLYSLAQKIHFIIHVVHVNHGIRGEDANKDEEYVRDFCNRRYIPFTKYSYNVGQLAKDDGISEEEAGRNARYQAFAKTASETGATKIAVAHNRNDQAETIFLNVLRGTGLDGLVGMDYMRGNIIRPLLDIDRKEIEEYCMKHDLKPRIDRTNLECKYTRNKVRLELFPYIQEHFGTDITDSLCRLSMLVAKDKVFINNYAQEALEKAILEVEQVSKLDDMKQDDVNIRYNNIGEYKTGGCIRLKTENVLNTHPAIAARMIRGAISRIKGNSKGIELIHVDMVMKLIASGKNGAVAQLPGQIRARIIYDVLEIFFQRDDILQTSTTMEEKEFEKALEIPGNTEVDKLGIVIEAKIISKVKSRGSNQESIDIENQYENQYKSQYKNQYENLCMSNNKQIYSAVFDYDIIQKSGKVLQVRNRRQGDVFKPNKNSGTKKLKKYFIDKKIDAEKREKMLLIALGGEIMWIIGNKTSDKFIVTENTKNVLVLFIVF